MPRIKSALSDKNKKLTDFFTPRSSISTPAPATSSHPTGSINPLAMSPTTRKRPATRASTASMNGSPINSRVPSEARSTSGMMTRKRARSPDGASISAPVKFKAARRPSGSDRPRAVIYISSRSTSPAKRSKPIQMHSSTLVTSPSDSSKQVVYSSLSDEAELVLPIPEPRDLGKVVQSVHTWRRKTFDSSPPVSPRLSEDAMEVDSPLSSPVRSVAQSSDASPFVDAPVGSAATPSSSTALQTPVAASAYLPSSPGTNEHSPLPPTPEPLDPEAKTAKLIAEIKARAFAVKQPSDNERPLAYRELDDSDDDDIIDELPLVSEAKRQSSMFAMPRRGNDIFSSPLSSVPSTFNDRPIGGRSLDSSPLSRPVRTSTRTRKPAPAFRLPLTIAESPSSVAKTNSRQATRTTETTHVRRSRATNPLKALLREKQLQDKRGTSHAALRRAEEAIRQGCREESIDSDDEADPLLRLHLRDEEAAWRAVRDSRKSASPDDPSVGEDLVEDGASKMLGAAAGKAINKILASDKGGKGKERARNTDQGTSLGISLWIEHSDEDMDIDSVSVAPLSGHPILVSLDDFLRNGDDPMLDSILRAGTLVAVPRDILLSNMPQLLDMALYASSRVSDAVCTAFRDLWGLNPPRVQMPLTAILLALVRLGANPSVLEGLGLTVEHAQRNHVSHETLLTTLKRLLAIVKIAAFAGAFASHDVANVLLSLVVTGLDSLTSNEIRTQLNITVDVVCNYAAMDNLLHDIHEKVLGLAKQLAPINKARLVSFFASGSARARCIAQHVAYRLLVSDPITPNHWAPPLDPLILSVSPDAGSCKLFDVANESIDYEELRHYVSILSVALAEISPYIEEERSMSKSGGGTPVPGSPSKSKKSALPPLELLCKLLGILQGKIVDTRAAHLDRSRAKAEIQRLAMRVNYERMALIAFMNYPRSRLASSSHRSTHTQ